MTKDKKGNITVTSASVSNVYAKCPNSVSVIFSIVMLSAINLNVVMLSVAAPTLHQSRVDSQLH